MLPNATRVTVPDAKVRDYLLSPSHPVGRFKAVFFLALGFSLNAGTYCATRCSTSEPAGMPPRAKRARSGRSSIRASLVGPSGRRAEVVTVWMVPIGQDFAHFVTAHHV